MNEQLLKTLESSRRYTLAVVEAMPEKSYQFKPTEAVWTFKELADHIAYGILWWEDNYVKGNKSEWNPPAVRNTKQQVIDHLTQAYDSLKNTLHKSKLDESGVNGFHATLDHITHHRGQAVTYLRCQGIVPPEYTY